MHSKKEANFYYIDHHDFYRIFPRLMEGIVSKGNKVLVYTKNDIRISEIDDVLWTFSQLSFLPHSTHRDEVKAENLVYITDDISDNANNSNFLAVLDNKLPEINIDFEKYLFFYDTSTMEATQLIAEQLTEKGINCTYIKQEKNGNWVKSNIII